MLYGDRNDGWLMAVIMRKQKQKQKQKKKMMMMKKKSKGEAEQRCCASWRPRFTSPKNRQANEDMHRPAQLRINKTPG